MKKLILASAVCLFLFTALTSMIAQKKAAITHPTDNKIVSTVSSTDSSADISLLIDSLYASMHLSDAGLNRDVFLNAFKGYQYFVAENALNKPGLLTICDFSQPSSNKRLYVLDLNAGKILFNTYVAHGRNSGNDYATSFSNSDESHKTCLGFMITAETYNGDNGYSMRLDGQENGFNNNVRSRAIVMHGSAYVNRDRALNGTMMGRSWGCPAVPAAEVHSIIDCIKGGSCFFNYYPDKIYTKASAILNSNFVWPVAHSLQTATAKIKDTMSAFTGSVRNLIN